ncbi:MAG: Phosphoglycerate kinase [Candidatus Moranbacteria bacterium GW2011_GWE1_35_17]|nr:MAG: Phosphoglycerate kinase [Candidatus Moranbacteria bacterium GW2011_GWE1_35_17]KKP82715.1 MAG: Phosphoglycerate kinase [Candidatus Moranbacteria bacterium GW2011_GWF1_35_5]KKP84063.1 MAG: Phosphoglycerate kinase [Candidatus Moranbacteria bacterium GW2011_GWF2_35_54]
MKIKKIQNADLKGKNVLVRVSFNVPYEGNVIKEPYKIETVKKTIDYIIAQGGKVTMMSNLGRPEEYQKEHPGLEWMSMFSFNNIIGEIQKILELKIKIIPSCDSNVINKYRLQHSDQCDAFLLENIKFYKEEGENDENFASRLAENFDVFVNESFSDCHRGFVSTVGVAKKLPSFAGFQLQKEVENLSRVKDHPEHPAVAIIGGAKIETKLPLINSFVKNYDFVLVGGKIANEAIDAKMNFDSKVILPMDFANEGRLDIGEKTIEKFCEIISHAETIVWNGPMGLFEKKPYDNGTRKILEAISESGAFSVIGGGESVQAVNESNLEHELSFISTGGGAMLEFLSGEPMPGLEVLIEK